MPAGVGHHVGGSAVAAGGLAVPDGVQFVGGVDHQLARGHVGLAGGLGERQAAHCGSLGELPVCDRSAAPPVLSDPRASPDPPAKRREARQPQRFDSSTLRGLSR